MHTLARVSTIQAGTQERDGRWEDAIEDRKKKKKQMVPIDPTLTEAKYI
jgi:hypothetical protein